MKDDTADKRIQDHTTALEKIYKQRRIWMYISSLVYTFIIFLIFGWDYITANGNANVWWVIISLSLMLSVIWWYWTMRSLVTLVRSIYAEYEILTEITNDINEIRTIIKNDLKNENKDVKDFISTKHTGLPDKKK